MMNYTKKKKKNVVYFILMLRWYAGQKGIIINYN
jgi:hypothetical protein